MPHRQALRRHSTAWAQPTATATSATGRGAGRRVARAMTNHDKSPGKKERGRHRLAKRPIRGGETGHTGRSNGPFGNPVRPLLQPAAGQAVCRSRPVGAKTARHPGCGSKAPKAETTHSRPQYKTKGAAPHDATPSKNPNLFISYRNITVIACFKMRWAASRIATRRQLWQHNAPYGMRPAMDAATHAKINITLQLLRV